MKQETLFNFSNFVTFSRIVLAFIVVFLVFLENANLYLIASVLVIITIFMDYIDGLVARKLHSITDFGGVFDIVGDRIVENTFWITFAYLRLIPLWVPLVVILRSFVTDGFRGYALSKGKTAFGKKTMMAGKIGIFFVSSRFSRVLYAIAKAAAFSLLAFELYLIEVSYSNIGTFKSITYSLVLFTVAFCIIRGFFVVYDGLKFLSAAKLGKVI